MTDNPYEVLGVSPQASEKEIKDAYRRMAKRYHPDLHPNDVEAAAMMNKINSAYKQIKNSGYAGANGNNGKYSETRRGDGFEDSDWRTASGYYETYRQESYTSGVRPRTVLIIVIIFYIVMQLFALILIGGIGRSAREQAADDMWYQYYYSEPEDEIGVFYWPGGVPRGQWSYGDNEQR